MQTPFFYPGRGIELRRVTASTGNTLYAPETSTIPNNGYSEIVTGADCLEMLADIVFGAAATGSVLVEKVSTQNATSAGETFDTITVTAQLSTNWNAGEALNGFYRFKNTSGQTMVVTFQKRIA